MSGYHMLSPSSSSIGMFAYKFVWFLTYARFLSVPCPQDISWKSSSELIREKQPAPQISINSVFLLERDRGDQVSLCKHNFFTQV